MIKFKSKGFQKALSLSLLGLMTVGTVLQNTNITASAHNAYFLAVTIDEGNFRYVPTVVYEENDWFANSHRETELGDFTEKTVNKDSTVNSFNVPIIRYTSSSDGSLLAMTDSEMETEYKTLITGGDGDKGLAFSFPGLHSRGFAVDKRHANGTDEQMAGFMSEYLVGSLNDTIAWVTNKAGGYKNYDSNTLKAFCADLSNKANTVMRNGGIQSIVLGSSSFTLSKPSGDTDLKKAGVVEGKTTIDDYVKIATVVAGKSEEKIALAKVNKGYQDRTDIPEDYKKALKEYRDPEFLNWQYIVLQANHSADVKKITFSSVNEIVKPGAFEVAVSNLMAGLLAGLRDLLGLYPMQDVMLNGGARDVDYYYGVMPKSWMNSSALLNVVCQIIAWSIMGFAFIKMLFKRQLSTMNIGERVSLMEGVKDLILTAFLLAGFYVIYHTMIRVNYALVDVFEASSYFSDSIGTTTNTLSGGTLSAIIINVAFFFINAYYNVAYVLRAFTVAMLYGLAPLAIVTISFGGKYKSIFSSFMKELVANIFMQTINAMCIAFFTSVTSTSQMRVFELFTVLLAFVPLNNFIRQNIAGLPSGITEQASGMVGLARGIGTATLSGLSGGKSRNGGGSGANSSGGNGINPNISRNLGNNTPVGSSPLSKAKDMLNGNTQKSFPGESSTSATQEMDNQISARHVGSTGLKSHLPSAKDFGKGAFNAGMAIANAGAMIGSVAIGDKRGSEEFAKNFSNNVGGIRNSMLSSLSSPELKNAGGKDLYEGTDYSYMIMDDEEGNFNDSSLNDTEYEDNYQEMRNCFLGEGDYAEGGSKEHLRDKGINYYNSQGINDVIKGKNGKTTVKYSNDVYKNRNWKPSDVINVAKYDPSKAK